MAHFVNIGELEELGTDMQKYAEVEIRGNIDKLLSLKDKINWAGLASDAYFDKFKEIMTSLYDYSDIVELFGYFLRYVSDDYANTKGQANSMLKEYIDEQTDGKKGYLWERG